MILFEHEDLQVIDSKGLFVKAGGPEGTSILLTDSAGRLLVAREFRTAVDEVVWGLPGGMLHPGETPEDCARRELLEEFGAQAASLTYLGASYPQPGVLDRKVHLFYGELTDIGESRLEPDEMIEAVSLSMSELQHRILAGESVDGELLCALQLAQWRGLLNSTPSR